MFAPTKQTTATHLPHPLLSPEDHERIRTRIARDHQVDIDRAESMLKGALSFLTMCAMHPGREFTPARPVDNAWHTFLLYSRAYERFCRSMNRRLYHEPNDKSERHFGGYQRTLQFMHEEGITYDVTLWAEDAAGNSVADPSTCCSEVSSYD
jgi:hypothetical protein